MDKSTLKKNSMSIAMIVFSLIVYMIGLLLVNNKMSWTLGILFGLIFSLLKLKLMQSTLEKAVQMPEAKAQRYANFNYMIRYVLTGIVLFVAALEPSLDLLGVFVGIFSMKVGAYIQMAIMRKEDSHIDLGK